MDCLAVRLGISFCRFLVARNSIVGAFQHFQDTIQFQGWVCRTWALTQVSFSLMLCQDGRQLGIMVSDVQVCISLVVKLWVVVAGGRT